MSKVVTIPDYTRPNWVCCINGVRYAYPAGSTQEVPDEVADLIEDQMEQVPVPDPVPEPVQPGGGVSSWNDLGESDNAVLLPETQFLGGLMDRVLVAFGASVELVEGCTYTINWNGVDYEAVCYMAQTSFAENMVPVVGNPLPQGGADNGLPFVIGGNEQGLAAWPLDGSTSATVSIKGYGIEPIPEIYLANAFPLCVKITGSGTESSPYVCDTTVAKLEEAYHNGRLIILKDGEGNGELSMYVIYYLAARHRINSTGDYQYGAVYTFSALSSSTSDCILVPCADGTYTVRFGG